MAYSFKEIPVRLNNDSIWVSTAQISMKNQLVPVYKANEIMSNNFNYTDGYYGTIRLDYYLTGLDPLTNYIVRDESQIISIDIGGLNINSGYLSNYSFRATPNAPIAINCEILFFESLKGSITSTGTSTRSDSFSKALMSSSINIVNLMGLSSTTNFTQLTWNYSADIKPEYYARTNIYDLQPDRVIVGTRQFEVQFTTLDSTGLLPYSGQSVGLNIQCRNINSSNTVEFFLASGLTQTREMSVSTNQILENSLSFIQHYEGDLGQYATSSSSGIMPTISGFTPLSGIVGTVVLVSGTNLDKIGNGKIGDGRARGVVLIDPSYIQMTVSASDTTGPITLYSRNPRGQVISKDIFTIIYPTIIVTSLSSYHGIYGDVIRIVGQYFYEIDCVKFGDIIAPKFDWRSDTQIDVIVPQYGYTFTPSYVSVISTTRNASGISPYRFSPRASIFAFVPNTGIPYYSNIDIQGANFAYITDVSISDGYGNYLPCSINSFDTTGINFTLVPDAELNGHVRVTYTGDRGTYSVVGYPFESIALLLSITGLDDYSGDYYPSLGPNEQFSGSAYNLNSKILDSRIDGSQVYFTILLGNQEVEALRLAPLGTEDYSQPMGFIGTAPSEGDFYGEVKIKDASGGYFPNPNNVTVESSLPPTITEVNKPDDKSIPLYIDLHTSQPPIDRIVLIGDSFYNWVTDDTEAVKITSTWRNLRTWNSYSESSFYIGTGQFINPDAAGGTLTINTSGYHISGTDNNIWACIAMLSNSQVIDFPKLDVQLCVDSGYGYYRTLGPGGPGFWESEYASQYGIPSKEEVNYNYFYDNEEWFGSLAAQISVRNVYGYGNEESIILKHPKNKLLLANGSPNLSFCTGQSGVKFYRPHNQSIAGASSLTQSYTSRDGDLGIYYCDFIDDDDNDDEEIWNFTCNANRVLADDSSSTSKFSSLNIVEEPAQNGFEILHYYVHHKTPYYVLCKQTGAWTYDFDTSQTIYYVTLLAQGGFHQGYGGDPRCRTKTAQGDVKKASWAANYQIISSSDDITTTCNIYLYSASTGLLASREGLVLEANGASAYQGYATETFQNGVTKRYYMYMPLRENFLFYDAVWFCGPITGVKRIVVKNPIAKWFVLDYIAAY